jgi:bifunctional DNA-binding transcriptional regulator/antitoxin component of YhaV-PrlF toxin-antitoxin module
MVRRSSLKKIKLTAKRQATLPQALCKELNLKPGDAIAVQKRIVDGKAVWCLEPVAEPDLSWMARFKGKARGKRHDMASIRKSIEGARRRGDV